MKTWWISLAVVVLASLPLNSYALSSLSATSVYTDYSSTNVSTTPVTILSSVSRPVREVHIFDSSGNSMLYTITSGPYITTLYAPPGGDNYTLKISGGDSVTIQSLSGTISSGVNIFTVLY